MRFSEDYRCHERLVPRNQSTEYLPADSIHSAFAANGTSPEFYLAPRDRKIVHLRETKMDARVLKDIPTLVIKAYNIIRETDSNGESLKKNRTNSERKLRMLEIRDHYLKLAMLSVDYDIVIVLY